MRRIQPEFPDDWGCEVIGAVVESDNPADLGEDMLCVQLANGILVSAGWSSEMDPAGHYLVCATSGLEDVVAPIESHSAEDAMAEVVRLVSVLRLETAASASLRNRTRAGAQ
ncbi:MAG TPA: hypothetical protein VML55_07395 [Planctomycetaceae bacterium]|nr:hypothetical protein [Planctomycetaceae bacterium]